MVAVSTISWEEVASPTFGDPARQAFRAAVAQVADKARSTLPECNGRVENAMALVLAGDVTLHPDGSATVGSQREAGQAYQIVSGQCPCKDYAQAPHHFCKHRLAAAITRRAQALLHGEPTGEIEAPTPAPPIEPAAQAPLALPEAPASVNCHVTIGGRQVQVTLRDTDESRLLQRLEALLALYPVAQAAPTPPAPSSAPAQQPTPEGWCLVHQVQMTKQTNQRGSWWSHKREEGSWCKGK